MKTTLTFIWSLGLGTVGAAAQESLRSVEAAGEFARTHCIDCHNDRKQKGRTNLKPFLQGKAPVDQALLISVYDQLNLEEMPPEDELQPDKIEREQMLAFVNQALHASGATAIDKKSLPGYGNYVDHEALFEEPLTPQLPAPSPRIWRYSPESFSERANRIAGRDGRLESSAKAIAERQHGKVPKKLKRVEDLLEAKDLDAVIVGTPDHQHTPLSIMACQAGKDVYVEKPFSHNVFEGRMLVQAARKYKRIVQVGTQNRSAPYNLAALEYIRSGKLGDIHLAKIYNLQSGGPFRLGNSRPQPADLDWARWLGPAPERPYHSGIFHAGWNKFWDFSGGDLAACGIHQIDLACMLLGDPGMPRSVAATGGRLHFKGDDAEVPDTQVIHFEFPGMVVTMEQTNYPAYMRKITNRNADVFPHWPHCATRIELYGSKEQLVMGRHGGGWQAFTAGGKVAAEMHGRHPDPWHQENFIDSIKSRKAPNSDVGILHASTALVHLGNIATRVGHAKLAFDAKTEQFAGEGAETAAANKLLKRQNKNQYSVAAEV